MDARYRVWVPVVDSSSSEELEPWYPPDPTYGFPWSSSEGTGSDSEGSWEARWNGYLTFPGGPPMARVSREALCVLFVAWRNVARAARP